MINSQLFDARGVQDMKEIIAAHQDADDESTNSLETRGPDEIRDVATRLVPVLETIYADHPGVRDPSASCPYRRLAPRPRPKRSPSSTTRRRSKHSARRTSSPTSTPRALSED